MAALSRSIDALFKADVRTPELKQYDETEATSGLSGLTPVLLQSIGNFCMPRAFRALCMASKSTQVALLGLAYDDDWVSLRGSAAGLSDAFFLLFLTCIRFVCFSPLYSAYRCRPLEAEAGPETTLRRTR